MRWALVCGILVGLPVACAQTASTYSFPAGFSTLHAALGFTVPDGDAGGMRRGIDANRDGVVTQAEVNQFIANETKAIQAGLAQSAQGNISLDGSPPTRSSVDNITLDGALGADGAADPIYVSIAIDFSFQPASGTHHRLVLLGAGSASGPGNETLAFQAAPGYVVATPVTLAGEAISKDGRTLVYTPPDGRHTVTIDFTPASHGLPGWNAVAVALLLLALARRRR
ncbi:MAG: hypothetical protein ACYDBQ_12480 [Thermoplasmatota archaeon]